MKGTVVVQMTIGRDGRLRDVRFLQRSKFTVLDEAARRAAVTSEPFPPLEGLLDSDDIKVNCRFDFTRLPVVIR
jgi:TonB family protein